MPKIYVEKRGFVLTSDMDEVQQLLAEGGRMVKKNNEINEPLDDLLGDGVISFEAEDTTHDNDEGPIGMQDPEPRVVKTLHARKRK